MDKITNNFFHSQKYSTVFQKKFRIDTEHQFLDQKEYILSLRLPIGSLGEPNI